MMAKLKNHAAVFRQVLRHSLLICKGRWNPLGYLFLWYLIRLRERRLIALPPIALFRVQCNGRELRLPVRTNTIVDLMTIRGIFSELEYGLETPPDNVRHILDLGANCGFASAFFSAHFPSAAICSVEPDPANLVQLTRTVAWNRLPVTIVSSAVNASGRPVFFEAQADHSTRSKIAGIRTGLAVGALRLADIVQLLGWDSIDLLKVDIEGAEIDIFDDRSDATLDRVRRIVFELHAWVDKTAALAALESRDFSVRLLSDTRKQVYIAEKAT